MEEEVIDINAKVEVKCSNHMYGEYIAEKVENLIKKHGCIKTDEILTDIDEKVESIKEVGELENRIEELENKIEDLEDVVDEEYEFNDDISVTIKSENHIVAEWAAEEIARIIKDNGTQKAYEIFKSIK